jgi:hypothetical protein
MSKLRKLLKIVVLRIRLELREAGKSAGYAMRR